MVCDLLGKKFVLMFGLVLMMGIAVAHDVDYRERFSESRYFSDYGIVLSRTVLVDYDNVDRFSTYDYRHGYSYRATRGYFEDRYDYGDRFERDDIWGYRDRDDWGRLDGDWDNYRDKDDWRRDYDYRRDRDYDIKGVRYEYVPYLGEYEAQECYLSPPSDRLFYVKC